MADKAWKALERRVAAYFGATRNPLSGGNSKQTRADVIHDSLYIEAKQRSNPSIWKLWEDTAALAKAEDKTPVVCVQKKGSHGFLIVVHCDHLVHL